MSDIRATLLKKFEARNPVTDYLEFRSGNYWIRDIGEKHNKMMRETRDELNIRWEEFQWTYAEAVRDCRAALRSKMCDDREVWIALSPTQVDGVLDGLTDERSSDGR